MPRGVGVGGVTDLGMIAKKNTFFLMPSVKDNCELKFNILLMVLWLGEYQALTIAGCINQMSLFGISLDNGHHAGGGGLDDYDIPPQGLKILDSRPMPR